MKNLLITIVLIATVTGACITTPPRESPQTATPIVKKDEPTPADAPASQPPTATPGRVLIAYPYTTPIPPPTPTIIDGVYTRAVNFEGTPTPCRRCAPYRAEGGVWTLILDAGTFRVSHSVTDFQGIGSFTVSGPQLALFNDPNCHQYTGTYTWTEGDGALVLTATEDECAFGLRAKNLAAGTWYKQDKCQPPSMEAATTGHWPAPTGCQ